MKSILVCGAVLSLFGVLKGSVLQTGTDLSRGYFRYTSNLEYSRDGLPLGNAGLSYGPSALSHGTARPSYRTSRDIGLTNNGFPLEANNVMTYESSCNYRFTNEVITDFRRRILGFMTPLFKRAAVSGKGHFIISLPTIWLSLAALAEGADGPTQQELFSFLNLPEDRCLRQIFYQLCRTREHPSYDVALVRNRFFITDSSLHINRDWEAFARSQTDLNTISLPFKHNPIGEVEALREIFNVQLPNLNLNGNSFLLETLDYRGLWTSAFSDAVIEVGPFHNNFGEQIGTVEYMKIKQRVKSAYVSSGNMKLVEFSVGKDELYKMIFAIFLGNQEFSRDLNGIQDTLSLIECAANVKEIPEPIEIFIPKLTMSSEMDVKVVLEDLGIKALWTDPSATRNISDPAALPSSFIQRVSVIIDESGIRPPFDKHPDFEHDVRTGFSFYGVAELPGAESLRSFVANRPFVFGLFDSETYTCLFTGAFSNPGGNH